jgi:ribosomal protein S18 acetylase RimI-like enzyme
MMKNKILFVMAFVFLISNINAGFKIVNIKPRLNRSFMIKAYQKERDYLMSPSGANTLSEKSEVNAQIKHNIVKILLVKGKTAGFITYNKKGHIDAIYVAPNYRKKGYSKILLNYTSERLRKRGLKTMNLDVFKNNTKAINAFKKFGFIQKQARYQKNLLHLSKKLR